MEKTDKQDAGKREVNEILLGIKASLSSVAIYICWLLMILHIVSQW